ncbi:MAG: TIGR02921 family PEP-CTERM protein, partial [Cyanobacteria bacterium P01_D01_bin.2]
PTGKRIAAILDSSYSMGDGGYDEARQQIQQISQQNNVDVYLTTAIGEPPAPNSDISAVVPYGSLQPADMLQQFVQQRLSNVAYDAVVLLTDAGSYELTQEAALPDFAEPLWLVHMGNQLPTAYDDALLETIQASGGGVATDMTALLQRLDQNVIDGYEWSVVASDGTAESDDFAPLAARQLILQRSRTVDMGQLENLDGVHAIAKRTQIVTPYSSMLVLVNDRQRELLRQAEAAADRFDREVEDGQDDLSDPFNPLNSVSVPEPGAVVGMGVMAFSLIVLKRKRPR